MPIYTGYDFDIQDLFNLTPILLISKMLWNKIPFLSFLTQATIGLAIPHQLSGRSSGAACNELKLQALPGTQVLSLHSNEVHNYTSLQAPSYGGLDFCNVSVAYTHTGEDDIVLVSIWLPLNDWNGRFRATGGGGLAAGSGESQIAPAVAGGYSAGQTDGGLSLNQTIDPQTGLWALNEDNSFNEPLLNNFGTRAIHDMAVIGKTLTETFYGTPPAFSYYTGCSTGGRQGYLMAQRYPEDFDGIMANAPALFTPELGAALFYPPVVMHNIVAPPQCVFTAYYNAVLAYCDPLDGATDGLISKFEPDVCNFDPNSLIGTQVACPNQTTVTISPQHAEVVRRIWQGTVSLTGYPLFPGNPRGANFTGLANTQTVNGTTVPVPFGSTEAWVRLFAFQDPEYNTANMTFVDFEEAWTLSIAKFSANFSVQSPDLSNFQNAGGKLLTFHGMADPLINPEITLRYRTNLLRTMQISDDEANQFQRIFFAPGVSHCSGGIGPFPVDPMKALADWTESGIVPQTLAASITKTSNVNVTRNLCPYPQQLNYKGSGDVNLASSFSCQ